MAYENIVFSCPRCSLLLLVYAGLMLWTGCLPWSLVHSLAPPRPRSHSMDMTCEPIVSRESLPYRRAMLMVVLFSLAGRRWAALLSNDPSKSSRTDIYYGITDSSVGIYGPALRSADGMKIIIGGWVSLQADKQQCLPSAHIYAPGDPPSLCAWS